MVGSHPPRPFPVARRRLFTTVTLGLLAVSAAAAATAQPRVLVVGTATESSKPSALRLLIKPDTGGLVLRTVDATTGTMVASATLPPGVQSPRVLVSPDGSRLVVGTVDPEAAWARNTPMARASSGETLLVLDAKTLAVLSTTWLGPGGGSASGGAFTEDGSRFVLLVRNFKAPKKVVIVKSALVSFDMKTGQLAGWVASPKPFNDVAQRDGRPRTVSLFPVPGRPVMFALSPEDGGSKPSVTTGAFIDLGSDTPAFGATLTIDGFPRWTALSPDRRRLYLAQRMGQGSSKKPEPNSRLDVIDLVSGTRGPSVELDGVVTDVRQWDVSGSRLTVVHERPSGNGLISTVRVVAEDAGGATATVDGHVTGIWPTPTGEHLAVWTTPAAPDTGARPSAVPPPTDLAVMTWPRLELVGKPMRYPSGLLDSALTPEAQRLVALDAGGAVSLFAVGTGAQSQQEPVFQPRKANSNNAARVARTILSNVVGAATGIPVPGGSRDDQPSREPSVMPSHDGAHAYVFSPDDGLLFEIELAALKVTAKHDVQGNTAAMLPGGRVISIESDEAVRLFDTTRHERLPDIVLPRGDAAWLRFASLSPDLLWLSRGATTVLLDAATGRVMARVDGLLAMSQPMLLP